MMDVSCASCGCDFLFGDLEQIAPHPRGVQAIFTCSHDEQGTYMVMAAPVWSVWVEGQVAIMDALLDHYDVEELEELWAAQALVAPDDIPVEV